MSAPEQSSESQESFRAPYGTHDVLPPESERWITGVETFARRASRFAHGLVMPPICEVLGVDDPDVDVEVIALAHGFYRELGLERVTLLLNSMGDPESRRSYVEILRGYFLDHAGALGPEFKERVELNPLRVLDAKEEA